MRLLALLAVALAALTACATRSAPPQEPAYYVMRHLHTPAGERDPDLTDEGRRHALMLAELFREGELGAIYVSRYKRSQQTVAPLAEATGLVPIVYDAADTPGLIAQVRAGPGRALIVGHSNTVPDIVEQLGGTRPEPLEHSDFGDVWRIGRDGVTAKMRLLAP